MTVADDDAADEVEPMTDEEWETWKEVVGITDNTSGEVNTNGEYVKVRRDDLNAAYQGDPTAWDRLRKAMEDE